MSTAQRARNIDMYRTELHKASDQMHCGATHSDLPVATIAQPKRPASAWVVAIAVLLIGGIAIRQAV
ncbi:MAG: hypothetical protein ACK2UK_16320 [Candidatus Promineifilaceae bacterium]|jgi:hypothetical protein